MLIRKIEVHNMVLFYWILWAIVALSEFSIIWSLVFCTDRVLEKHYISSGDNKKEHKFVLMIPAFDEANYIEVSFNYFKQFIEESIHCVYITTEKESQLYGTCRTKEKLVELMKNNPSPFMHVCHYPYSKGNKVDQLNYFINHNKEKICDNNIYLLDLDCDSRPDIDIIYDMKRILKKYPDANVIQLNSRFWSVNKKSPILNLEAFYQTRWSLGFERLNQYFSTIPLINRVLVPFAYCVGHGMCIRSTFLYRIGQFPQPLEDVPLGMMLMLMKEPIYPCVSKDLAEIVPTTKALLKQAGHWLRSPLQAMPMYRKARRLKHISIYRTVMYFARVALDILSWLQYLIMLIVALFLLEVSPWYLVGYFVLLYITSILSLILIRQYKQGDEWDGTIWFLLLLPLRHFIRGLSIFSFIYQKYFGWFYDKRKNQ